MLFELDDKERIRDYHVDQNLTILNYKLIYMLRSGPRIRTDYMQSKEIYEDKFKEWNLIEKLLVKLSNGFDRSRPFTISMLRCCRSLF
jgi:hypothetical protein